MDIDYVVVADTLHNHCVAKGVTCPFHLEWASWRMGLLGTQATEEDIFKSLSNDSRFVMLGWAPECTYRATMNAIPVEAAEFTRNAYWQLRDGYEADRAGMAKNNVWNGSSWEPRKP